MLESALLLLIGGTLLMLRLSPNGSFPNPLSAEEERKCLERWAEGDVEARNTLVEHNMRLVSHIIKKYYTQGEDMDDLISIGTIGLIKGINTYRPEKGVRLATYASRCCENEILMYFRSRKKTSSDVSLSDALELCDTIGTYEICRKLRSYVDTVLTEREAAVIKMRYGLENALPKTQKETAEMCGISRSYVSRIEKRALLKLREVLGEDSCPY